MISLNCRLEQRLGQCFSVMGGHFSCCSCAILPMSCAPFGCSQYFQSDEMLDVAFSSFAVVKEEQAEVRHLFQRLSLILMRGNVSLLVNRVPSDDEFGAEVSGVE